MKLKSLYIACILLFTHCKVSKYAVNDNTNIIGKWGIVWMSHTYYGGRIEFYSNGRGKFYHYNDSTKQCQFTYNCTEKSMLEIKFDSNNIRHCDMNIGQSYFNYERQLKKINHIKCITLKLMANNGQELHLIRPCNLPLFF